MLDLFIIFLVVLEASNLKSYSKFSISRKFLCHS
jgi:hypothetical protein